MKFLHTSDWQLGMTRHFLGAEAQARFTQARFDAIVRMAELASERGCAFVVVAGDVFDTNQADRRTVARALESLRHFTMPVYLLPGNHDCLEPGSVFASARFAEGCPADVHVLADGEPVLPLGPQGEVEIVGAPWFSKQPLSDLTTAACEAPVTPGRLRVVVGHGGTDAITGGVAADPALIRIAALEAAIAEGKAAYVALGDRHSCTEVGSSGRVWYSGAPEPTAYPEEAPGKVLVVDVAADGAVEVEPVQVGTWHFHRVTTQVDGDADLAALQAELDAIADPARAIVKVAVTGSLTLRQLAALDSLFEDKADVFGALENPERHRDLVVRPASDDFRDVVLEGYAATARGRLQERAAGQGHEAEVAADALALLLRLSQEPA